MKKPGILMIVENHFPGDPRVRKESDVLRSKYDVSVLSLRKVKTEKTHEVLNGVRIFRMPEVPDLKMIRLRYILEYAYFTFGSALIFLLTHGFLRYRVVHVHNPPDTLFLVGLLAKLLRVKFVYDHHDLSPELYLTRFSGKKDAIYRGLIFCEKQSCRVADVVICTNESYKRIEMGRHGIAAEKIFVVRNNPIISDCTFSRERTPRQATKKRIELLFLGSINPQDGLDTLLEILSCLVNDLNEREFICRIVGGGDSLKSLQDTAERMHLGEYLEFTGMVYDRQRVREYLCTADIGLEPAPENALNAHSTFIKVMEYMAASLPTVAFDLVETRYSAGGSAILLLPGSIRGYAEAIQKLMNDPALREELGNRGLQRVTRELTWEQASSNLINAYARLLP